MVLNKDRNQWTDKASTEDVLSSVSGKVNADYYERYPMKMSLEETANYRRHREKAGRNFNSWKTKNQLTDDLKEKRRQ